MLKEETRIQRKLCKAILFLIVMGSSTHAYSQDTQSHISRSNFQKKVAISRGLQMQRAQQQDSSMSILTRRHPEYEPLNIRVNDFVVAPSVTNSITHTDNVYETARNKISDFIAKNMASIGIKSDFLRHQIFAGLSAENGHYMDQSTENYNDYKMYVGGRIDASEQWQVPLALSYARDHTKRDDPDDKDGEKPTVFENISLKSGLNYIGHLFQITYSTIVSKVSYQNNYLSSGAAIYNGDRDRTEFSNTITVGLSDNSEISPFLYAGLKDINYDDAVDDFNINKDSHGWDAGAGLRLNLSGVTSSTFRVGTVHRNFDDPSLSNVQSMAYGVDVNWEPSSLMSVALTGQRYIDESSLVDTSAIINSSLGLGITYELAPNIYVYPEIQYLIKDYQSSDNHRIDRLNSKVSMVYKLNQNIWSTLSYQNSIQHEELDTTPKTESDTNTIILSVKFQL